MISKALKVLRQYHRLTQSEMAARLSISTAYLSELESGSSEPSLDIVQRYADVFNLPLPSLLIFSETLSAPRQHSKVKKYVSRKMLKILEWIAHGNDNLDQNSRKNVCN